MLAYAANRPVPGRRQSNPQAMLIIVGAHVAALALVMSAKMDLPQRIIDGPIKIINIPLDPLPPPPHQTQPAPPQPPARTVDDPLPRVPVPPVERPPVQPGPTTDPGSVAGGGAAVITEIPKPAVTPIHHDARLLTPPSQLKPPYPTSKLLTEEEAVLNLRLSIDDQGRVFAVDPVGRADREFLDAARRYLIAHWRYEPASDDGRNVASFVTVTLRFTLDG